MATKVKPVRTSAPQRSARRARILAREQRACAARIELERVAHAWVASVREKIAELIQAGYAIDNAAHDPDAPGFGYGIACLSTIINLREVTALVGQLEQAEHTAARLLVSKGGRVPRLTEAVLEADAAIKAAWPAE